MNDDFIFRGGKHNGQTYGWVRVNDPSYIRWCKDKAPFMLETKAKAAPKPAPKPEPVKEIKFRDKPVTSLEPNLNFWNEGPDPMSLPYLKKMQEKDLDN
jgi:hypothetical protein